MMGWRREWRRARTYGEKKERRREWRNRDSREDERKEVEGFTGKVVHNKNL